MIYGIIVTLLLFSMIILGEFSRKSVGARYAATAVFGAWLMFMILMMMNPVPDKPKFTEQVDSDIANVLKYTDQSGHQFYRFKFQGHDVIVGADQ